MYFHQFRSQVFAVTTLFYETDNMFVKWIKCKHLLAMNYNRTIPMRSLSNKTYFITYFTPFNTFYIIAHFILCINKYFPKKTNFPARLSSTNVLYCTLWLYCILECRKSCCVIFCSVFKCTFVPHFANGGRLSRKT